MTPSKLRCALALCTTQEAAAAYVKMTVPEFANACLEHGILWPDTLVPEALGIQRKDARLAGELSEHRQAHLRELSQ